MDNKTMLHSQKVYFCNDEELATKPNVLKHYTITITPVLRNQKSGAR